MPALLPCWIRLSAISTSVLSPPIWRPPSAVRRVLSPGSVTIRLRSTDRRSPARNTPGSNGLPVPTNGAASGWVTIAHSTSATPSPAVATTAPRSRARSSMRLIRSRSGRRAAIRTVVSLLIANSRSTMSRLSSIPITGSVWPARRDDQAARPAALDHDVGTLDDPRAGLVPPGQEADLSARRAATGRSRSAGR